VEGETQTHWQTARWPNNTHKKSWKEVIAYFPLIRHRPHRKLRNAGHRQQGDLISFIA
jgi:hypothetical protein